MTNQVDHYAPREPADRYHPDYDTFTEWLDAEAPAEPMPAATKTLNLPRHYTRRNAVTLAGLMHR